MSYTGVTYLPAKLSFLSLRRRFLKKTVMCRIHLVFFFMQSCLCFIHLVYFFTQSYLSCVQEEKSNYEPKKSPVLYICSFYLQSYISVLKERKGLVLYIWAFPYAKLFSCVKNVLFEKSNIYNWCFSSKKLYFMC